MPKAKVKVKLFANLRELANTSEIEIECNNILELLEKLCNRFKLENIIFNNDNISPYINIFINGKDINELKGIHTSLRDGDEVAIFPPVSGG